MNRLLKIVRRRICRLRKGLRLDTFGFAVPPFTASFRVRHGRNKITPLAKVVNNTSLQVSSPLDILWDTVETMTDDERRRAIKRRDWETAIVASIIQGYVRRGRTGQRGGGV